MMKTVRAMVSLVAFCYVLSTGDRAAGGDAAGIPPETVADFLHSVIESDRTFYTIHVVERLQKQGAATAAETWRADKTSLPLPAQFLHEANDLAAITGSRVRYRLISLWPINPANAPANDAERSRLEAIMQQPERASTGTVLLDGQQYFQAVYADRAVTQACVACHNAHPNSPKKDFTVPDVMGGLVIEIPLK
jgi:cytochrome c553